MLNIKSVILLFATFLLGLSAAWAADYPKKPVKIIVPFNAGGATDLLARAFEPPFAKALGGDAYVADMGGGSGTIGASSLAGKKPDGYRLGVWSITVATVQPQIKNVPYGLDSWTPICQIAASPTMLFVKDDSPFKNMKDVVEAVKAHPGKYTFGSSGPGTLTHLSSVAAFSGLGVLDDIKHLPFKGSGPALQGMAAGFIQFYADTELFMQRGNFRPLIVFNDKRLSNFPDVPTAAEVGIKPPLNELYLWQGLFAPAGLDKQLTQKLSMACKEAVESKMFQDFAERTKTVVKYMDAHDFNKFYRSQYSTNIKLIDAAGL